MGRTHRSAQNTSPAYSLVTSDLAAETRFASTVARRAGELGAVTSADRRGTQASSLGSELLVGPHAYAGVRSMFEVLDAGAWPAWFETDVPAAEGCARVANALASVELFSENTPPARLLGRVLGVPKAVSNFVVDLFSAACEEAAALAKRRNPEDEAVEDVVVDGEKVKIVSTNELTGAVELCRDIGVDFAAAEKRRLDLEAEGVAAQYYFRDETRTSRPDRRFTILAFRPAGSTRIRAVRPNGRLSEYVPYEFRTLYALHTDPQADWDAEFEKTKTTCNHGCKNGKGCGVGLRLVNSTLLPFPGVLNQLSNVAASRLQIVRMRSEERRCCVVKVASYVASRLEVEAKKHKLAEAAAAAAAEAAAAAAAEAAADEEPPECEDVSDADPTEVLVSEAESVPSEDEASGSREKRKRKEDKDSELERLRAEVEELKKRLKQ
jgi:hypothetical protein